MPDDSAQTPRPDADPVVPPDEAATVKKTVTSPRRKPSTPRKPRKPRARQPVETPMAIDGAGPAGAASQAETPEVVDAAPIPDAVDAAPIPDPEDAATMAGPEDADPIPGPEDAAITGSSLIPVAVDPAPDHAPPEVALEPLGATSVASPAGPVTLAEALASDGVRRVIVTVSYLVTLVGALAAFGLVDSGAPPLSAVFSPRLSLLAAAAQTDRLWWVVLLGLAVYVGWLWLPGNAADPRSRAMAYPSAAAMIVLGLWFFLVRSGELFSGSFVSLLVVGALMLTLRAAETVPSRGFIGRQCAQLGFAAALGWMTVLTAGAIAGALVTHEVPAYFVSAETWGILGTTALLGVGMALVRYFPGRLYIAGALAWGFVGIAYARVVGEPRSYFVGVVALVSALLILVAGAAVFFWVRGRARDRSAE